jgi:hypothetical protein
VFGDHKVSRVRSCILHVSLLVLQSAPPENGLALL